MFVTSRSWVARPVAERARAALGVLLNAVTFLVEDMSRSEFIKPLGGLAADGGSFDERSEEWLTPVNRAFS
jgi:hypothetical protein